MFKKKQTPINAGRTRTTQPAQRGAVFSYANSRSIRPGATGRDISEQKPEVARRSPRFPLLRRAPALVSVLAGCIVLIALLQLGSNARVVTVGAASGKVFLRDHKVYEAAAHDAFSSLLNSNKLTVDTHGIATNLRKQFPELAVVSVSLPIVGNRPEVYIQPATPKMILATQGGMYLLDSAGRALITTNQITDLEKLQVPVVTDQSDLPVKVGEAVLPQDTVAFISEVTGQLQAKQVVITSLTLPAGTNELHTRIDGVGYSIKFNMYGQAKEQVGAYLAVKEYLESQGKAPSEYVDVRVENKVYYK